jgi:hypothetical protein
MIVYPFIRSTEWVSSVQRRSFARSHKGPGRSQSSARRDRVPIADGTGVTAAIATQKGSISDSKYENRRHKEHHDHSLPE